MKTTCNRTDCVNCKDYHCVALKEAIQDNCPFYKNSEKYEIEMLKNESAIKKHFQKKLNRGETISPQDAAFLFNISIKSKELSLYHIEILEEEISKSRRNPNDDEVFTRCGLCDCIYNKNSICQVLNEVDADNCSFYKTEIQQEIENSKHTERLKKVFSQPTGMRIAESILNKYQTTANEMPEEVEKAQKYGGAWKFEIPKPKYF
jgi:hypothetical protein